MGLLWLPWGYSPYLAFELTAQAVEGKGSFSLQPEWKQMFLFVMEAVQYVITQHNSVFIAEKCSLFLPLCLTTHLTHKHTQTHTTPLSHPAWRIPSMAVSLRLW